MKVAKADDNTVAALSAAMALGAIVAATLVGGSMMGHYRERAVTNNAASYDPKTGGFVWADALQERRGKE